MWFWPPVDAHPLGHPAQVLTWGWQQRSAQGCVVPALLCITDMPYLQNLR